MTCREAVPLNSGKKYSALELQKEYLDLAHRYYSTRPMSPEAADILQKWEYVLTKLEEDPMQLHHEIDWVIKLHLLQAYGERTNLSPEASGDRMLMLDLQYHDIRREKGLYFLLERKGQVVRLATMSRLRKPWLIRPKTPGEDAWGAHQARQNEAYPLRSRLELHPYWLPPQPVGQV